MLFVVRCCLLIVGCWSLLLDNRCLLFVWLFGVLFVVCCCVLFIVVRWVLSVGGYVFFVDVVVSRCLWFVVRFALCLVCCCVCWCLFYIYMFFVVDVFR